MAKRRVFISFDHDDTQKVNGFLGLRNIMDGLEFYNHKLDHEIQGQSDEYKRQKIREKYIRPGERSGRPYREPDGQQYLGFMGDR